MKDNVSKPVVAVKPPLNKAEFIALMAALMAINALAIDIMLPALPAMGEALNVASSNKRQWVIGAYVLGFGITQLVVGPLSDRFGRKVPLLAGVALYIVAAFSAIEATSFETLLFMRFVQGVGASGTRVITMSVIRDLYQGSAMAEITSLVFMVFMVVPILAPNIGQLILLKGSWFYIFGFMGALASVLLVWAILRLPETLHPEYRRPFSFSAVTQGFGVVFGNRVALFYGLTGMFVLGGLFGFITSAQQIYVDLYGLWALFPVAISSTAAVMSFSSFVNSKIVSRFGMRAVTSVALFAYVFFAVVLLIASGFGLPPLWLLFICITGIMCCFGWVGSNTNALSMEPLGEVAGTASSVFGFMQTAGSALLGSFIGQSFDGTVRPLAMGYLIFGLLALGCMWIASGGKLFGRDKYGSAP